MLAFSCLTDASVSPDNRGGLAYSNDQQHTVHSMGWHVDLRIALTQDVHNVSAAVEHV